MSAQALQRALAARGIRGEVEARERVAVLRLADPAPMTDESTRTAAVALAVEHGFRTLSVELDAGAGADVHRD